MAKLVDLITKIFPEWHYRRSSYSQTGEDRIIDFVFQVLGVAKPTYLDIGAHSPYYINNTALFYRRGARGVNIEPHPLLWRDLNRHRPHDTNLQMGIGAVPGTLDFYVLNVLSLSTFSKVEAEKYCSESGHKLLQVVPCEVITVQEVLKKYCKGKYPDLLSLDAEGLDFEIIKSMDFSLSRPRVICVETLEYTPKGTGKKNYAITEALLENGYFVFADTFINTIYVERDAWYNR